MADQEEVETGDEEFDEAEPEEPKLKQVKQAKDMNLEKLVAQPTWKEMLLDLVVKAGAAASKGEARRAIDQGGLYVNNERVSGQDAIITPDRLLADAVLVLRFGKKRYHLVKVV